MIQLYKSTNDDFSMNGDYVLSPISCEFDATLNEQWVLTLEEPLDNSMNDLIVGAVISAPTPYGNRQLFRIYECDKDDSSITVNAYPIFLDSKNDCFLWDVRPTNKNGQDALNIMLSSNPKYSAISNIAKTSTSYYVQKNFIEALNSDDENSFINRWGGEITFNNYQIIVNDRIGADNGLKVEFGFNITGIKEKIDSNNLTTRIIPKSYNGYILPNNETVDSPLINNYPKVYMKVIEYQDIKLKDDANESDVENVVTICDDLNSLYRALRQRAKQEFENDIDKPDITYDVDMIDLSKTDLYKDYENLLTVNLGDTVHVKHRKLNIVTNARVISLSYDCIAKKIKSLTLGNYEKNYFNNVSSMMNSVNKVVDMKNNSIFGDKIKGIINLLNTSLKAQKSIAQKQDVRAILFEDTDPESTTFGAMCLGTKGIQIAGKRNETNTDWAWGTAIDFQTIYANYILAGILSDVNGNNYWNLDTGELNTKYAKMVEATINESYINNATIVNAVITGLLKGTTIEGGTISGTNIITNEGTIGGWTVNSSGFTNGTAKIEKNGVTNIYTWADLYIIRLIIMKTVEADSDMVAHYDFNGDGSITSADYMNLKNKLKGL